MKFDYEEKYVERDCVAYIDEGGDLTIRDENPSEKNNRGAIYLTTCGNRGELEDEFNPDDAIHKFYPGDKITITF